MKHKTVNLSDELWARMEDSMARVKIFNSSEFIRLALEAAVERVERRYAVPAPVLAPTPADEEESGEE